MFSRLQYLWTLIIFIASASVAMAEPQQGNNLIASPITFIWSATKAETEKVVGFQLYYGTTSRGVINDKTRFSYEQNLAVAKVTTGTTGWYSGQLNDLLPGTRYYAAVTARAQILESAWSEEISFVTPDPTPGDATLPVISQLSVANGASAGDLRFRFRASGGVNGLVYQIQGSRDLQTWEVIDTFEPTEAAASEDFDIAAPAGARSYFFRVSID
ncbi:MAG TPA: fibronectin type III domain-containing protein [Bdellovibrionota bacterium]|jgi:hypothetical protein|nr:fibronectin type III domain-containing protein [Bdellovibrionota bacterium]